MENSQPKGIGFFNIKSGETHYARLEPQIQAFINSSDLGINASRGQDFGWRLSPEWVKRVKIFRRNETKMQFLTERNGGKKPTISQILYAIYGEQLRAAQQRLDENENPFEEEYLRDISSKPEEGIEDANPSEPTDRAEGTAESSEEVDAASDSDQPADSAEKPGNNKPAAKPPKKK